MIIVSTTLRSWAFNPHTVVRLLCGECVSDISVSRRYAVHSILYISVNIVSYHVSLSLFSCRDSRSSCWYSIVLIFSTLEVFCVCLILLESILYLCSCCDGCATSGGRSNVLILLMWHFPYELQKTSASVSVHVCIQSRHVGHLGKESNVLLVC